MVIEPTVRQASNFITKGNIATQLKEGADMFDKLKGAMESAKNMATDGAIEKVVGQISPQLAPHLDTINKLAGSVIKDDAAYEKMVISPILLSICASTSGATSLIPQFEKRFTQAMFHLRNEIIKIDETSGKVSLIDEYRDRLPSVLIEGFKQPV